MALGDVVAHKDLVAHGDGCCGSWGCEDGGAHGAVVVHWGCGGALEMWWPNNYFYLAIFYKVNAPQSKSRIQIH